MAEGLGFCLGFCLGFSGFIGFVLGCLRMFGRFGVLQGAEGLNHFVWELVDADRFPLWKYGLVVEVQPAS